MLTDKRLATFILARAEAPHHPLTATAGPVTNQHRLTSPLPTWRRGARCSMQGPAITPPEINTPRPLKENATFLNKIIALAIAAGFASASLPRLRRRAGRQAGCCRRRERRGRKKVEAVRIRRRKGRQPAQGGPRTAKPADAAKPVCCRSRQSPPSTRKGRRQGQEGQEGMILYRRGEAGRSFLPAEAAK